MKDHTRMTVEDLKQKIRKLEDEIVGYKRTVNLLCEGEGERPVYGPAELETGAVTSEIKSDTFYGQPLNTSIRRILEMRKASGQGPATVRDIFDALTQGGYQHGTDVAENAMRGLRISLGKSSRIFHKLPNGSFGLLAWYPDVKVPVKNSNGGEEPEDAPDAPEQED